MASNINKFANISIPSNLPRPSGFAPERVDSKRVTINGERRTIHLLAYGWETRHSWGHAAFCPELGTTKKVVYYNRTWEAHRFDSVLSCLMEKCLLVDKKQAAAKRKADKARLAERKAQLKAAAVAAHEAWTAKQLTLPGV